MIIKLPAFLSNISKHDYQIRLNNAVNGISPIPGPISAVFLITSQCNANCVYCLWGCNKEMQTNSRSHIKLENALLIIKELQKMEVRYLHISGGEPTIYPGLIDVIKCASSAGMHVNIASNGTTLSEDYISLLSDAGLNSYSLSYDSVDIEYNRDTRGNGNLDIVEISRLLKILVVKGIWTGVNAVLYKQTPEMLKDLLKWCSELSIGVQFQPVNTFNSMPRKMLDRYYLKKQVETLLELKDSGYPILNSRDYLINLESSFSITQKECRIPWTQIVIDSEMNVGFCCLHEPYYSLKSASELSDVVLPYYYRERNIVDYFPKSCSSCFLFWTDNEK
jgi:MoaA/NifB/PqqE/SkfB family radical SAM enzyme